MKRTVLNRSITHNEWFEELCALAAIGELSAAEFAELQQHRADCATCRELYADFCRITSDDIGLAAIDKQSDETGHGDDSALDEQALLGQFMERAQREREAQLHVAPRVVAESTQPNVFLRISQAMAWIHRSAWIYVAVALLLAVVAGIGAYRFRDTQLSPTLERLRDQLGMWQSKAAVTSEKEKSATQLLSRSESEREVLQEALADAQTKYEELQGRVKALSAQLASANAQIAQQNQDMQLAKTNVEQAKALADQKDKMLEDLRGQLRGVMQLAENQGNVLEDVRRKLKNAEQAQNADLASTAQSPPVSEEEAKELLGARDLHIVDVYDVDASGHRRRTYGRVFYVEKKQLVFYAFDLEGKKHNRAPASFQAWGYLQANQGKPQNLGTFNLDNAALSRWVLKVDNRRILQHIDAVFVTLEPLGGSPVPRGRKLLYAYLNNPPNHP